MWYIRHKSFVFGGVLSVSYSACRRGWWTEGLGCNTSTGGIVCNTSTGGQGCNIVGKSSALSSSIVDWGAGGIESGSCCAGQSFVIFFVVVCRIPLRIEDSRWTFITTQSLHLEGTRGAEELARPPASVEATGSWAEHDIPACFFFRLSET